MDTDKLKTQTQIRNYTRDIINNIGICDDIKNKHTKYYNYFTTFLFPRHPLYPEKFFDMENVGIHLNEQFRHLEVYILKSDGSKDVASAMKQCVSGKKINSLSCAMRNAIYTQIQDYRNNATSFRCKKCNTCHDIQVDHSDPQFIDIQKSFLESIDLPIPTSFDDNNWNGKVFKENDRNFERKWYKYHLDNANLRFLCKSCNLHREKSLIKFSNMKIS